LLAQNFQLYESLGLLKTLRESELSSEEKALEEEIGRIEAEMAEVEQSKCSKLYFGKTLKVSAKKGKHSESTNRTLLPAALIPDGVKIEMLEEGQLGLVAAQDFEEGSVVFQESPLGISDFFFQFVLLLFLIDRGGERFGMFGMYAALGAAQGDCRGSGRAGDEQ
jgi:hypothetical protein